MSFFGKPISTPACGLRPHLGNAFALHDDYLLARQPVGFAVE
jgi:hypothetical protein